MEGNQPGGLAIIGGHGNAQEEYAMRRRCMIIYVVYRSQTRPSYCYCHEIFSVRRDGLFFRLCRSPLWKKKLYVFTGTLVEFDGCVDVDRIRSWQ